MFEGMMAERIRIRGHNNDLIDAYLARPLGAGPFPAVLMLHHMPGWDEDAREVCRKFAHHGYIAVSPNLHHREAMQVGGDLDDVVAAVRAAGGVPDERCIGDAQGAVDYLRALPYNNGKVGVIGHCSGGRQTYMAACKVKGLDAAVDCYGGGVVAAPEQLTERAPVAPLEMTKDMQCPVLGLFGVEDPRPSPSDTARTEEELKKHGKVYEFHTYDNAGHGFFHPDRPGYRQHAAVDGWERIWAWFGKYLA